MREGGIAEAQPAVGAENRDALVQRLQRLALHAVERVEARFEIIGLASRRHRDR